MKILHKITFLLLIAGGLNWLLFAIAGWDVSRYFGGMDSTGATVLYVLIGVSAIYGLIKHMKNCEECKGNK